ncbi:hypothetical protein BDP27DRAFT_58330 [Rhodocollybia butyracea]|uniref:DUF6697 domain-containing protein n=1 Tax=Rhodocollybia butyracea TaxID=206335 RepID=A0A9P5U368_9AGAR|nr:hypothetical protein BDP27DRAFT_58330 [Rhodocollybia butyracea]
MKKTDKEMKFVKQQEPCSSQLTSPSQSSKRKAEAEIALPYGNDDRAATLKKLKFTKRRPRTSPPKIMTAVASTSTSSSDPAPKQNSSPPSLPKFQSSPSQLTFRAHLKSLRSSMPSHVPQSPSGWAGFPLVQIRRDLLNNLYGMGTQQLLVRIARDRNPLPPFTSRSSDRHVIFPNLDRNPLPQKRGDPGFIITARLESAMTLEQCSLFIKTSSKVAIWDYLGEYKLTPSGKIGGKFGTQCKSLA